METTRLAERSSARHLFLAAIIACYALPILIVASAYMRATATGPASVSDVICSETNKPMVALSFLSMGATCLLYEYLYYDRRGCAAIVCLLASIFGVLATEHTLHLLFALLAFTAILFFMEATASKSRTAFVHAQLGLYAASVACFAIDASCLFEMECVYLCNFALYYLARHFADDDEAELVDQVFRLSSGELIKKPRE